MIILLKFASENRYFIKELADIMLNFWRNREEWSGFWHCWDSYLWDWVFWAFFYRYYLPHPYYFWLLLSFYVVIKDFIIGYSTTQNWGHTFKTLWSTSLYLWKSRFYPYRWFGLLYSIVQFLWPNIGHSAYFSLFWLQQSQYTFYLTRHRNSFEDLINWHNFIVGKS